MRRIGTVTVLSVAGVLLAAGTAGALNARVLGAGTAAPIGSAESFVTLDQQPRPASPSPSEADHTTGTSTGATPSAVRNSASPAVTQSAARSAGSSTGPRASATSSTRNPGPSRTPSSPRPSASADDHGGDLSGSGSGSGSGGPGRSDDD